MAYNYSKLNADNATIWRIVHHDNLPWILENGLHCGNSNLRASNWVSIGNDELISKRANHPVPVSPNGVLNDYVPFYFTPFSAMMMNVITGRGGVQKRQNDDVIFLVSKMHYIQEQKLQFLFTDMHAYYQWANFYNDLAQLDKIDWPLLQKRDFKRDPDDPAKFERYQAEALIHRHCPITGLLGIDEEEKTLKEDLEEIGFFDFCNK